MMTPETVKAGWHTPTPWRHDEAADNTGFPGIWGGAGDALVAICDRGTHDDGTAAGVPMTDREVWANAELIVRAVNSHTALVAACRAVVEQWESGDLAEAAQMCAEAVNLALADAVETRVNASGLKP